jgi:hypothetical protein
MRILTSIDLIRDTFKVSRNRILDESTLLNGALADAHPAAVTGMIVNGRLTSRIPTQE